MGGVGSLPAFLWRDQQDACSGGEMRKIRRMSSTPVPSSRCSSTCEHSNVSNCRRVRRRVCGGKFGRGVRLVAVPRAHGDGGFVRIDPDASRPDEVEATADPTADVEHPTGRQPTDVPPIGVGNESFPSPRPQSAEDAGCMPNRSRSSFRHQSRHPHDVSENRLGVEFPRHPGGRQTLHRVGVEFLEAPGKAANTPQGQMWASAAASVVVGFGEEIDAERQCCGDCRGSLGDLDERLRRRGAVAHRRVAEGPQQRPRIVRHGNRLDLGQRAGHAPDVDRAGSLGLRAPAVVGAANAAGGSSVVPGEELVGSQPEGEAELVGVEVGDRARPRQHQLSDVALAGHDLLDTLVDRAGAHEAVGDDRAALTDSPGTVARLVFDSRVPPTVVEHDVVGGGEVEPGAARLQRQHHRPRAVLGLELVDQPVADSPGEAAVVAGDRLARDTR